jgi:hypothetical protein
VFNFQDGTAWTQPVADSDETKDILQAFLE